MNTELILRQLSNYGSVRVALDHLDALKEAAAAFQEQFEIEWYFDPGTPVILQDYLLAGAQGAAEGAIAGATVGAFLALIFPPAIVWYAAGAGAVLGAARRVEQVRVGWRVCLVRDSAGGDYVQVDLLPG